MLNHPDFSNRMQTTLCELNTSIKWTILDKLEDLDYANVIALLSHLQLHMQDETEELHRAVIMLGLQINGNNY